MKWNSSLHPRVPSGTRTGGRFVNVTVKHVKPSTPLVIYVNGQKYDPNQPREPRGTPGGGRWAGGDNISGGRDDLVLDYPSNERGVRVYHSPTKGDISSIPSVDIGSDYDIMGKGFYFGTHSYASRYGEPQEFVIFGNFATGKDWSDLLSKYKDLDTATQRANARTELQNLGFSGVINKNVGVVWDQDSIKMP